MAHGAPYEQISVSFLPSSSKVWSTTAHTTPFSSPCSRNYKYANISAIDPKHGRTHTNNMHPQDMPQNSTHAPGSTGDKHPTMLRGHLDTSETCTDRHHTSRQPKQPVHQRKDDKRQQLEILHTLALPLCLKNNVYMQRYREKEGRLIASVANSCTQHENT